MHRACRAASTSRRSSRRIPDQSSEVRTSMKDILGLVAFPTSHFSVSTSAVFLSFALLASSICTPRLPIAQWVSVLAGSLLIISTTLRVASPLGWFLGLRIHRHSGVTKNTASRWLQNLIRSGSDRLSILRRRVSTYLGKTFGTAKIYAGADA